MIDHISNLLCYSALGFLASIILFFVLAGMMIPGEQSKRNVQRIQDAAGLNMILMVISTLCWGAVQIFKFWLVG